MSERSGSSTPSGRGPEDLPAGGTARAAGGLFEGFLRDWTVNGAVLFSLIVVVAGFLTGVTGWAVVGLLIGVPGIVLPWLAVGKKWSIPAMWLTALGILVVDIAVMSAMWLTA